jgi:hypothetical protein
MKVTLYRNKSILDSFKLFVGPEGLTRKYAKGKYEVVYNTIFGNKERIDVDLINNMFQKVTLYSDYLNYSNCKSVSILDRLPTGKEIRIAFHSVGCFSNEKDTIYITKSNEDLFIRTSQNKSKQMTKVDIDNFKLFEIELNSMKLSSGYRLGGAARSDYQIDFPNEKPILKTGIYDWYGFDKIEDQIFPKGN